MYSQEALSLPSPDLRRAYLFALWTFGEPQRATQEFFALRTAERAGDIFAVDAGREALQTLRRQSLRTQVMDPSVDLSALLARCLNVSSMPVAKSRKVEKLITLLIAQSRALRDVIVLSRIFGFSAAQTAAVLRLPVARTEAIERLGTERLRHEFSRAIARKTQRPALYGARVMQQFDQTLLTLRGLVQRFIYAKSKLPSLWQERLRQRAVSVLPLIGLVAWFLLPVALVAGVSELLLAAQLHLNRDWPSLI